MNVRMITGQEYARMKLNDILEIEPFSKALQRALRVAPWNWCRSSRIMANGNTWKKRELTCLLVLKKGRNGYALSRLQLNVVPCERNPGR
jgi:hypothetical protein